MFTTADIAAASSKKEIAGSGLFGDWDDLRDELGEEALVFSCLHETTPPDVNPRVA